MTRESLSASPAEIAEKERRVRDYLASRGLDALVLSAQANFAWFTCGADNRVGIGTDLGASSILITPDSKYIICDNIEAPRVLDEEVAGQGFEFVTGDWWTFGLPGEIAKLVNGEFGADTPIPGARFVASEIGPLRYSLTEQEIERYRWLGRAAGECLAESAREVRPGMTEHEIGGILAKGMVERGIVPNLILVAADERIERYRHPIATDNRAERCAMLVIGAKKWGLVVSATRIVHFGPVPADLRRKHDAVMAVDAEFISRTRPGASVAGIFQTGVDAYAREGFADEWRLHHQGGPTGYAGRDYKAGPGVSAAVQPNQAFAWNPSITGAKSEDTIIALDDRTEIISACGDWPTKAIGVGAEVVPRPDILEV